MAEEKSCSALPAELERASEFPRRQLQRETRQQPNRLSDLGREGPYDDAKLMQPVFKKIGLKLLFYASKAKIKC